MNNKEMVALNEVISKLLDPSGGCPWDLKQTHLSLLPYLIEESYEFIHEAENHRLEGMKDELGDILLQVLLHAKIAEKKGNFGLEDVAKNLKEKLIYRHPHVFGENHNDNITSDEVVKKWATLKEKEKIGKGDDEKNQDKIPLSYLSFPALLSSHKIGKKTQDAQFDWDNYQQVLEKVEEELKEFKEELQKEEAIKETKKIKEELGDLFFTLAQLARHLNFNAEEVLREANQKFFNRYNQLNDLIKTEKDNKRINQLSFEEKELYWKKIKKMDIK